jgi:hypothetical protein
VPRRQVLDGIPADNRNEANQIIARLLRQQKPLCATPTPTPSPITPTKPGAKPTPTRTSAPPSTPTSPANPSGTEAPGDEGCRP